MTIIYRTWCRGNEYILHKDRQVADRFSPSANTEGPVWFVAAFSPSSASYLLGNPCLCMHNTMDWSAVDRKVNESTSSFMNSPLENHLQKDGLLLLFAAILLYFKDKYRYNGPLQACNWRFLHIRHVLSWWLPRNVSSHVSNLYVAGLDVASSSGSQSSSSSNSKSKFSLFCSSYKSY